MNTIYLGNPPSSYIKWITAYYKGYYTIIHYNDGTPSKEVHVGNDGVLTWELIGKTDLIEGNTTIQSVEIGREVTAIGDSAFHGCSNLTSVIIPVGVTSIGIAAFYGCSSLTSVTIPSSVTSIGNGAFEDCSGLTSVTISEGVSKISDSAFAYCSSLTSIIIPESMTAIGENAFAECIGLTSVTIPSSVTEIGNKAFSGVNPTELTASRILGRMLRGNLKTVTIPEGVSSISDWAFDQCSNLTSVTIPSSVTTIGEFAFQHCGSLTSVMIPDSVTLIDDYAFYECSSLTSVTFEGVPTTVGTDAFVTGNENTIGYYLSKYAAEWQAVIIDGKWNGITMEHIVPEYTIIYYNNGIQNKEVAVENDGILTYQLIGKTSYDEINKTIESVEIGSDVISIGNYAFDGCESLTYMTIPKSVTDIGDSAFEACNGLTSVTILDGVTDIGDSAFEACNGLTSIAIPESVSAIGSEAFKGCANITKMSLPLREEFFELGFYEACFTTEKVIDTTSSIKEFALSVCDSASMLYANTTNEYTTYAYGTNMYFEGGVTYYFSADYDDKSFIKVDDSIVIAPHSTECIAQTSNITFENSGWRWIELRGYNHASAGATNNGKHTGFLWWTSLDDTKRRFTKDENNNVFYTRVLTLADIFGGEHINIQNVELICSASHIPTAFFAGCLDLTSVTIPASVTTIGNHVFDGCSSLTSITFKGTPPTTVGTDAFATSNENTICYYLHEYATEWQAVIVDGKWNGLTMVKCAPEHTIIYYNDGKDNKEVTVGDDGVLTWEIIGKTRPLQGDKTIQFIEIGSDVTSIGNYAFDSCSGLTQMTIPSSVTSIGDGAFEYCSGLTFVTIPAGVTTIGDDAFYSCSGLTSVYISDIAAWCSIQFSNSYSNPLYYAKALYLNGSHVTNLEIPEGVTSISNRAFYNCSSLTSVTIPSSVRVINDYAFYQCRSLTTITIPEGVTEIDSEAFQNCSSLTTVTIPSSVTSINTRAFNGCSSLTEIDLSKHDTPPSLGSTSAIPSNVTTIYIKPGTLPAWQSATNWKTMSDKLKEKTIINTDENMPVILSMLDATTGETTKLSPDCSFVITGTNLNLDQLDEESGFYIVTSGGQNLKCTVIAAETNTETGENEFILINPVSFTDSASYIMYKQLTDNNSYYMIRYPQNNETFVIE